MKIQCTFICGQNRANTVKRTKGGIVKDYIIYNYENLRSGSYRRCKTFASCVVLNNAMFFSLKYRILRWAENDRNVKLFLTQYRF